MKEAIVSWYDKYNKTVIVKRNPWDDDKNAFFDGRKKKQKIGKLFGEIKWEDKTFN